MKHQPLFIAGVLALVVSACGKQDNSQLDGHYENSTSQKADAFAGAQVLPPEYAPVQSEIVSQPLLTN